MHDDMEGAIRYYMITADRCFGYDGEKWGFYFWFVGWDCVSLGLHVCFTAPNIEIHLPFGFIRIGIQSDWKLRPFHRGWCFFTWWQ